MVFAVLHTSGANHVFLPTPFFFFNSPLCLKFKQRLFHQPHNISSMSGKPLALIQFASARHHSACLDQTWDCHARLLGVRFVSSYLENFFPQVPRKLTIGYLWVLEQNKRSGQRRGVQHLATFLLVSGSFSLGGVLGTGKGRGWGQLCSLALSTGGRVAKLLLTVERIHCHYWSPVLEIYHHLFLCPGNLSSPSPALLELGHCCPIPPFLQHCPGSLLGCSPTPPADRKSVV